MSAKNLITSISQRKLIIVKGILLAIGVAIIISCYYLYETLYPNTDNAYVGANLATISAKVGGFVQNIDVKNNEFVKKGQILLEINPIDYNVDLIKSQHNLAYAKQKLASSNTELKVEQVNLAKLLKEEKLAILLAKRYKELYQNQVGSQQDMQTYHTKAQIATKQVQQEKIILQQKQEQFKATDAQMQAQANNVETAHNYYGYTRVFAPVDGYISNLNLVNGQLIKAHDPIFGLVDNTQWWVDANFKETQIERIRVGQSAIVELDMYHHKYHGVVKSISYASGNTFALLPSENATGNWVKVAQRFTVRILLNNDKQFPLRVGASATVKIDTTK